jgi:SAM-dependent methyltransferase
VNEVAYGPCIHRRTSAAAPNSDFALIVYNGQTAVSLHWLRNLARRLKKKAVRYHRRITLSGRDLEYTSEIDFWDGYLKGASRSLTDPERRRRAFPPLLRDVVRDIGAVRTGPIRLLEVGSGPTSLLAAGVEEGLFQITAVDPLARTYARLLARHSFVYPVRPIEGSGESLSSMFAPASFDVVYSSNALDHTVSPAECLRQICEVLRPGGMLLLEGFVREGSTGGWEGLHQHDLFVEDHRLAHEDRSGRRSPPTEDLPLVTALDTTVEFRERGIDTAGYELPDGQGEEPTWARRGWYTILFRRT